MNNESGRITLLTPAEIYQTPVGIRRTSFRNFKIEHINPPVSHAHIHNFFKWENVNLIYIIVLPWRFNAG